MFGLLIAVIVLIVYGSLYPWQFHFFRLSASPLWILLHSWNGPFDRRFVADVIVNIAIYLPLGMTGFLALTKARRYWLPVAIGTVLSACIEMLQIFAWGRHCNAFDLVNNILGSALGVLAGAIFETIAGPGRLRPNGLRIVDRSALALLYCWVAALLFPFFPVIFLAQFRAKFARFAEAPLFDPVLFLSDAASWFVAGRLISSAGSRSPNLWLALSLIMIPAQFLTAMRQPLPVDFLGSIAGFALFCAYGRQKGIAKAAAIGFLAILLVRGLAPFHFGHAVRFQWIPFGGFLDMDWQAGILVLTEKLFYYGAAVWLLRAAGLSLRGAACIVATLLAGIEAIQIRLPGRVPEITDPLLALLTGFGLGTLNPRPTRSDAALLQPARR